MQTGANTGADGEDVARNLDFAAHHTLIESEYFQEALIRRRAEALAGRISATIVPHFGLHKPLALWEVDILTEWNRKETSTRKDVCLGAQNQGEGVGEQRHV